MVVERQGVRADVQHRREISQLPVIRPAIDDVRLGHQQQGLVLAAGKKSVQRAAVEDLGRQAGGVEPAKRCLVAEDVALAQPVFGLLPVLDQLPVGGEKGIVADEFPLHQGGLDEDLPGLRLVFFVSPGKVDDPAGEDRQAEQRGPFLGDDPAGLFLPVRLRPGVSDQRTGQGLQPLRLDGGDGQGVESAGLEKGGGDKPLAAGQELVRAGKDHQLAVAGPEVQPFLLLHRDVAEKAGEQGLMDALVGGLLAVFGEAAVLVENPAQLFMQVQPLPHALEGQVMGGAEFFQPGPGLDLVAAPGGNASRY